MEKIIYIYNKNLELIGQPFIKDYEEFKENPIKYYPSWDNTMYASLEKYNNPVLDKKIGEIREKTREELILLDNKLELLQDGEYVEAGEIIVVEAPDRLIKKIWNKEIYIWEEGATREELIEERKNKILEYKKLKDDKKDLEDSGFSSEEEILMLSEKMALLEADINNLAEKIKGL
ncbi:hypothetical protein [Fusobacterium varium]|uniref:Uncharacterized protein n=1 Tax=Fusobacterium varium ATCC 27725 TaxID=469618 RepID=A0ABM6U212_FUSVA|nr:hypothetical protein [Fusobacterium varium]AVQ30319.1 hypothetical protein C4N18_03390 [Fusobacterium varium ATCC 27725]EES64645.1 hypothetical protein FVAG_01328 [Fusobacterium varium ATCC 27725]VEH37721.1 Uncharacterised protein [Fusobacterium varium]